jgi:hypothetical protein
LHGWGRRIALRQRAAKTCSPYDFIDYGNGSSNASCKSASAPTSYSYIEVRLQKNFGNVPIFNIPVTLSAHAVASTEYRRPAIMPSFRLTRRPG